MKDTGDAMNQEIFFNGLRYTVTEARGICDRVRHHTGGQTQPAALLLEPIGEGTTHAPVPMCQACFAKYCSMALRKNEGGPTK